MLCSQYDVPSDLIALDFSFIVDVLLSIPFVTLTKSKRARVKKIVKEAQLRVTIDLANLGRLYKA